MGIKSFNHWYRLLACCLLLRLAMETAVAGHPGGAKVQVLEMEGTVEFSPKGSAGWYRAYTNLVLEGGDAIRTAEKSRLTLRWSDNSTVRLPPLSHLQVEAAPDETSAGFNLLKGLLYLFHREKPTDARFRTRTASAAVRGTELVLAYDEPQGRTMLAVLDGEAELSDLQGQKLRVSGGEQGFIEPGAAPRKTALLSANSLIQWCLYYPGTIDLDDLKLRADEEQAIRESLLAYRSGDLLGAVAKYPAQRQPGSANEQVYLAAVLLAVGEVEPAERLLQTVPDGDEATSRAGRLAEGLRQLISAVQFRPFVPRAPVEPSQWLASEWLAESYYQQSRSELPLALEAARRAVERSPGFGLGWTRVAELQFSFGRTGEALQALEKGLGLAPRNAQGLALKGFLLAAQNKASRAMLLFDEAIALDGGLGNAWLGRGLCKIRQGLVREGKDDIQVAVTLEPQRAVLRSYLAKAYQELGDRRLARKEIQLAEEKDPGDPTSWLYSALLNQEQNRINEAVQDLERSKELNENRSVYRSRLLLDQDQAVRGANLAAIYRDAGMFDVSVREAGRAVNLDYGNYTAHLFLANSYSQLLDSRLYNLRYESATVNEYLVATLLAPVGAGVLSPTVSQQEYSRLFERDGPGFYSSTAYLSRGAWQENAAQYGRWGSFSYSLDGYYRWDPGQYENNDLQVFSPALRLKQQITDKDSVYLQVNTLSAKSGDLAQYYDPLNATNGVNRFVRVKETQEPLLLAGYHREWRPGQHTLLLAGRLQDTLTVTNPLTGTLLLSHLSEASPDTVTRVRPLIQAEDYRSELQIYTAEAQQILQYERFAFIFGGRYQSGDITTDSRTLVTGLSPFLEAGLLNPPQNLRADLERLNSYAYAHWQAAHFLRLIGGVSYDRLIYPENFRFSPLSAQEKTTDQVSPKAGLLLTPIQDLVARAAYSRSLGGATFDQSFQLEPSQVAGFNQAWRSLIPESVAGANTAAAFETWNAALEYKLPTRTYLGVSGEWLNSKVNRTVGVFDRFPAEQFVFPVPPFIFQSTTAERLTFREKSLLFTVNQLLGAGWSLGAAYRLSRAELQDRFPGITDEATLTGGFRPEQDAAATLHQVNLSGIYNHWSGLFTEADALWLGQRNDTESLANDYFWQGNLFLGYRFPRRQAELRMGVLNVSDQNYRLNPLNLLSELPRERTLVVTFKFIF